MSFPLRWMTLGLFLCSTLASGADYQRTTLKDGRPIYWDTRTFRYRIAPQSFADKAQVEAVEAAVDTWAKLAATCSEWKFERGPDVEKPLIGYREGSTNDNVVVMRNTHCRDVIPKNDDCLKLPLHEQNSVCANKYQCWFDEGDSGDALAVTLTTYVTKGKRAGLIVDADIEFNAAPHAKRDPYLFTTVDSPPCKRGSEHTGCVANDVQNVMTHELGHAMGFEHVEDMGSLMADSAELGELSKRNIDPGTQTGFCAIYDLKGSAVRAISAGTASPVTGCNAAGGVSALALSMGPLLLWHALRARRQRRGWS